MKVLFVTSGAIACNVSSGNTFLNLFGELADTELYSLFTRSEVPTINGDGKQSRDFTYIDNVIEANLKACLASHEAAGNAFNIAYGGREYLIDIYYGLTKALGVDVEPNFGPDRKGDIKHSNADISKARRLLGYDPDYSLRTASNLLSNGIRRICNGDIKKCGKVKRYS